MPRTFETSERSKKEYLKTHYYKTTDEKMMDFLCHLFESFNLKIASVNADYLEINATSNDFDITAKVFSFMPLETAVDFYVDSRFLFDFNKTKKNVFDKIYDALKKEFQFLGTSLHKEA
jgi:hypothetical protein